MTTYQLTGEWFIYRWDDGVRSTIPLLDAADVQPNPDAVAYRAWLAAGGVPDPHDSLVSRVPHEVPRWAGLLALRRHALDGGALILLADDEARDDNLESRVLAWRATLAPGMLADRVDVALRDANDWLRSSETVAALALVLGLTGGQVDSLFLWADQQEM